MDEILPPDISVTSNHVSVGESSTGSTPVIRFLAQGQEIIVDPMRLTDAAYREAITQAIRAAGTVHLAMTFLSATGEQALLLFLEYLVMLGDQVHFLTRDGREVPNLLDGILAAWERGPQYVTVKHAALYTGAIRYRDELEIAAQRIAVRAREIEVTGLTHATLMRELRQICDSLVRRQQLAEPEPASVLVRSALPDAPVAADVVVPPGWRLSENCTLNQNSSIPAVVLILSYAHDVISGEHEAEIAYQGTHGWRTVCVSAKTISDARSIVELSNLGIPVTSLSAASLIQFLADFRAANRGRIPNRRTAATMGWQQDGRTFLVGRTTISASAPSGGAGGSVSEIRYKHPDAGTDALAEGYASAGTFEGWQQAVRPVMGFPRIRLLMYATLAPALLKYINVPNFTIDYCYDTTCGKSSALQIGASSVGRPGLSADGQSGIVYGWDSTQVWRERALAAASDLPTFFDDTKLTRFADEAPKLAYIVSTGQGRGRGSILGTQIRSTFRTIVFSTGEVPIVSMTKDGGVKPRVMTLWGMPFPEKSPRIAELIRTTLDGVSRHHGHFFVRFVRHLIDHFTSEQLRARYEVVLARLRVLAGTNEQALRQAESGAAISLACELAHEAFSLPWSADDPVVPLWADLVAELDEHEVAADALRLVAPDLLGQRARFARRGGETRYGDSDAPAGGWIGNWNEPVPGMVVGSQPSDNQPYIAVIPSKLNEMLIDLGFSSPETIYRAWKQRGWLFCSNEQGKARTRYATRMNGKKVWLIAIKMEAIESVGAESSSPESPPRSVPTSAPAVPPPEAQTLALPASAAPASTPPATQTSSFPTPAIATSPSPATAPAPASATCSTSGPRPMTDR